MFIGIYRSNEVDEAHYLSKTIRDMHEAKNREVTEVSVGNLDQTTCEEILVQLLSVDPSAETSRLAEICHKRTLGNAFHMLAYVAMLKEENLLEFNLAQLRWTWKNDRIEEETAATSNVVELMEGTISKQSQKLRDLLQLVASLGASFERDIVICAFPQMQDDLDPTELEKEVDELLAMAVQEAFLEQQGYLRYRWVHDSIQAAAMQQGSEAEMNAYQFKLGKALIQSLADKDVESNLFEIVNLLNSSVECPETDKMTVMNLNLKAAKVSSHPYFDFFLLDLAQSKRTSSFQQKAVEFSSFESCVSYAGIIISLLLLIPFYSTLYLKLKMPFLLRKSYLTLAFGQVD